MEVGVIQTIHTWDSIQYYDGTSPLHQRVGSYRSETALHECEILTQEMRRRRLFVGPELLRLQDELRLIDSPE